MIRNADQKALWALFKRVTSFLEENEIEYYLFAGTAIGALRHGGFIPWDNDIDLLMDRENYYRMISMADSLPWDDVELVSSETSEKYFRPYAQFSYRKDTSFLKSGMFNKGECMGTLIDVMVMDDVPSGMLEEYKKDLLMYQEVLVDAYIYNPLIADYADEYVALRKECDVRGKKAVIEELRKKLEDYSKYECDQCVVRFWGRRIRNYRKEWFDGERKAVFEEGQFPVPARAEACLRLQYGDDWYCIPREHEQEVHDFYSNHNVSYNNYSDDLDRFVDWDETDDALKNRKILNVQRMKYLNIAREYSRRLFIRGRLMDFSIDDSRVKRLADDGRHDEIIEMFEPVLTNIRELRSADMETLEISEESVEILTEALAAAGRYADGLKVAKIFDTCRMKENVFGLLMETAELAAAYQDNDTKTMALLTEKHRENRYEITPEYITATYRLRKTDCIDTSFEEIEAMCDAYLDRYPENQDVAKAKADCMAELGREAEARSLYREVYDNSSNGLIIKELFEAQGFEDRF